MTLAAIESKAMKLSLEERSQLAVALLESLDGANPAEIERLWLDEAERRERKFLAGRAKVMTAKEAMARARRALRP